MRAGEVVKQIETPRFPDPIMRRPRADREEKRATCGNETSKKLDSIRTGRIDFNDPNQRRGHSARHVRLCKVTQSVWRLRTKEWNIWQLSTVPPLVQLFKF